MPKVGNSKFPYDEEGIKDAQKFAAETNQPVEYEDSFGYGTYSQQKYQEGGQVIPKEKLIPLVDIFGQIEKEGKEFPAELINTLKSVNPANYAGFFGGEDFAEELQRIQRYIENVENQSQGMQRGGKVGKFGY